MSFFSKWLPACPFVQPHIRKRILFLALGALGGYAYYYFIGCYSGACPISGNPYISTLYGAAIGFILTLGGKKTETLSSPAKKENFDSANNETGDNR